MHTNQDHVSSFQRITIIGVGLIGGSLALAIKHRYPSATITGVDKKSVLRRALSRQAIDVAEESIPRAVRSADLVILSTPVHTILHHLPLIAKHVQSSTIVTDTGSIKRKIIEQAAKVFPAGNFIGGHPMTGAEFSGIEAAHPLLFQNVIYLLTPSRSTRKMCLERLTRFLVSLDARVLTMDSVIHDKVVAAVSHLPQLSSIALMNTVGNFHPQARKHLSLAAGGFRDMTRIASSPFKVWKDILRSNSSDIAEALTLYIVLLRRYTKALRTNPSALQKEFKTSRSLRSRIPRTMKGFLNPLADLSVYMDDRPGQLARLTTALAKANINVKDIELLKVREGRGGTFKLSFENQIVAKRADKILRRLKFKTSGL